MVVNVIETKCNYSFEFFVLPLFFSINYLDISYVQYLKMILKHFIQSIFKETLKREHLLSEVEYTHA